ncbi:helix-turn-helix domain-containing protein [Natronolimnohabitans sp. A-GB9]|nr:helix-turn-helix domain-containing protein [Natronolimnohabitans sp. A-GB9]MDQ2049435.1 helix-turn-helix domain-containing protein [Natronolimnohabitans sp. A-GB9]
MLGILTCSPTRTSDGDRYHADPGTGTDAPVFGLEGAEHDTTAIKREYDRCGRSFDVRRATMRAATVTLSWDGDGNPIGEIFGESDAVSVDAIRYINPVHGDRYVELLELRGDLERARTLLEASETAVEHDVAGHGDRGVAYVQCRTVGLVGDLLAILWRREIVVDWPLSAVDAAGGRGLEITVIGTDRAIQRAAADLPEGVDIDLQRLGPYDPDADWSAADLTARQRELFEVAVREGYYEVPRETTQRELAAALGLATGTVGEHLRRIESKLAGAYATPLES